MKSIIDRPGLSTCLIVSFSYTHFSVRDTCLTLHITEDLQVSLWEVLQVRTELNLQNRRIDRFIKQGNLAAPLPLSPAWTLHQ
jgi:hypothetical protein